MKSLPAKIPVYSISKLEQPPFSVEWKELMGWFIIPELGKNCAWAIYDLPSSMKKESYEMHTVRRAIVHGIEGMEISAKETLSDGSLGIERLFVAQETDTHTRFLLERHYSDDVMHYFTFFDTDEFIPN